VSAALELRCDPCLDEGFGTSFARPFIEGRAAGELKRLREGALKNGWTRDARRRRDICPRCTDLIAHGLMS
jgi:hypothetical protein